MSTDSLPALRPERPPWNKGRIIVQKRALLLTFPPEVPSV